MTAERLRQSSTVLLGLVAGAVVGLLAAWVLFGVAGAALRQAPAPASRTVCTQRFCFTYRTGTGGAVPGRLLPRRSLPASGPAA